METGTCPPPGRAFPVHNCLSLCYKKAISARLIEIYNEYRYKGLLVIGVNLDSFGTHRVVKFLDGMETKINFPVTTDKNRLVAQSFSAMVLPTTLLIDANSKIRFYNVGYRKGDEKSLRNVVARAVKEIKK